MKLFRRWCKAWAVVAVLALLGNIALCALRCAGNSGGAPDVLGPLAFCAAHTPHGGAPGDGGGAGDSPDGHAQHHCIVCQLVSVLAGTAFLAVALAVLLPRTPVPRPWSGRPWLALHIEAGALRSRAPPFAVSHRV